VKDVQVGLQKKITFILFFNKKEVLLGGKMLILDSGP
jgi:hypothetical protein